MLREIPNVRQVEGEPRRRFFMDDYFELMVWLDQTDRIIGFELSYDVYGNHRALKWLEASGYMHCLVDEGDQRNGVRGLAKGISILIPDGIFPKDDIVRAFEAGCTDIEERIASFVRNKILEYHLSLPQVG